MSRPRAEGGAVLLGTLAHSPSDAARLLALYYYIETERFDRRLSGRWSPYDREAWIPFDLGLCNRNAVQVRRRMLESAKAEGVTDLQAALDWARDLTYPQQVRELDSPHA